MYVLFSISFCLLRIAYTQGVDKTPFQNLTEYIRFISENV